LKWGEGNIQSRGIDKPHFMEESTTNLSPLHNFTKIELILFIE
jgi:hypothetical protein